MKKRVYTLLTVLGSFFLFSSCDQLEGLDTTLNKLTIQEIVAGLRQALTVGSDTTTRQLALTNGYMEGRSKLTGELLKIILPAEITNTLGLLRQAVGTTVYNNTMKDYEDKLIESLNLAASDAAKTALPVFTKAITDMTIEDGVAILKGADSAATNYLRVTTFDVLKGRYAPKIDSSLSKPLLLSKSANDFYSLFRTGYNTLVDLNNVNPFKTQNFNRLNDPTLGNHVTQLALRGLFLKIRDKESDIRNITTERVTELLQKVFDRANWNNISE